MTGKEKPRQMRRKGNSGRHRDMIGVIFSPKVEVVMTNHSPYVASQLNAGYVGKVSNMHVQVRVKQEHMKEECRDSKQLVSKAKSTNF
jgi:hypothetical protein